MTSVLYYSKCSIIKTTLFLTECLISIGMNYSRQVFYKVSDYISFKSQSPYKFLPHTFLFSAAIELFRIKAPLAGKGETYYDFARRKDSEKRWEVLHGSLPLENNTEEVTSLLES